MHSTTYFFVSQQMYHWLATKSGVTIMCLPLSDKYCPGIRKVKMMPCLMIEVTVNTTLITEIKVSHFHSQFSGYVLDIHNAGG
jgi:hypothetical protein